MELLGTCEIQYANNLLSSKKAVLRTDRDRGDNPYVELYSVSPEQKLLMRIIGDKIRRYDIKSMLVRKIDRYLFIRFSLIMLSMC